MDFLFFVRINLISRISVVFVFLEKRQFGFFDLAEARQKIGKIGKGVLLDAVLSPRFKEYAFP